MESITLFASIISFQTLISARSIGVFFFFFAYLRRVTVNNRSHPGLSIQVPAEEVPAHVVLPQDAITSSGSLLWHGPQCGSQRKVSGHQQNHQH